MIASNKTSSFPFLKLQNFNKNNKNVCYANSAIQLILSCGNIFYEQVIFENCSVFFNFVSNDFMILLLNQRLTKQKIFADFLACSTILLKNLYFKMKENSAQRNSDS
jgi:hypothetical protein